jgi:Na+-driven multidrug efflux pump
MWGKIMIEVKTEISGDQESQLVNSETKVQKEIKLISYSEALKEVIEYGGNGAFSKLPTAINIFSAGIIMARLGVTAAASGPFITLISYAATGSLREIISSTGMVVGELHGEKKFSNIGSVVCSSWILGGLLSIPVVALHLTSANILIGLGIPKPIAEDTQNYLTAMAYGFPALFWIASDMAFAIGVKKPRIASIAGTCYAVISMAAGYPLALYGLGIKGLGFGSSLAAWSVCVGLRLYFLTSEELRNYGIFEWQIKGIANDFSMLLKRGTALFFQNISEWGNLLALSIMVGRLSEKIAVAQEVALRPISFFNIIQLGFSNSVGARLAHYLGESKYYSKSGNNEAYGICIRNARLVGNLGILIGAVTSIISGVAFVVLSPQLINFLSGTDSVDYAHSFSFLLINSIGLLPDSIRNITTRLLIGNNDIWFSPLISFLFMSAICAPTGGIISLVFQENANWIYITRDIGIGLSAITIGSRWFKSAAEEKQVLIQENSSINSDSSKKYLREGESAGNNYNSFFYRKPSLKTFSQTIESNENNNLNYPTKTEEEPRNDEEINVRNRCKCTLL